MVSQEMTVNSNQADALTEQDAMTLARQPRPPPKLADVPPGAPARRTWLVERKQATDSALEKLCREDGPAVVGLVGDSGCGKTTAASEIVRSTAALEFFSDGVVWLPVDDGAKDRLPSLMLRLARMVHEELGGCMGRAPTASEDGAAYVREQVRRGRLGRGLRCLIVADNVWEDEVVVKLRETGMWVLVTTRAEELVVGAGGEALSMNELSKADAELLLRRASALSAGARLPRAATDLVELCGRVAMDLAFVGRWSSVRGREDPLAWSKVVDRIRAELNAIVAVECPSGTDNVDRVVDRRRAILRAGLHELSVGTDDGRVQRLYLALGVMPNGRAFTAKDAAVLLYDGDCSIEQEAAVGEVLETLERWAVLTTTQDTYRAHDAHASFARESLTDRRDFRQAVLKRWVAHLSSVDAVVSIESHALQRLWSAVEIVGGEGWRFTRPYQEALAAMDDADPLCRKCVEATCDFYTREEDWEAASALLRRLLAIDQKALGDDHPFVVHTLWRLAECAERMGEEEESTRWQARELAALNSALARTNCSSSEPTGREEGQPGRADPGPLADDYCAVAFGSPEDISAEATEKLLQRSLEIELAKPAPDEKKVAFTLQKLGVCVRGAGRLREAEALLRRCLGIREARLGPSDLSVALTLHELGGCARQAERLHEAEQLLRRALSIREARLGRGDVLVAFTLNELGACVREAGRPEEAEESLRRALEIKEAAPGPDDVQVAYTLHQLSACARQAGRLGEAEESLRRALRIKEACLGAEDASVASTLFDLGQCVRQAGRREEAEGLLMRALEIWGNRLGPNDVQLAFSLHELGGCARQAGRLVEAERLLRRALEIRDAHAQCWAGNVWAADTMHELGVCMWQLGRLDEADKLWRRNLEIREAVLGANDDMQIAATLHNLGVCVREAGRLEEAEKLLRRALDIKRACGGGLDSVYAADTLHELGSCVRGAGRLAEAEALLRRALEIKVDRLGPEHISVARTLYDLGLYVRQAGGRLREAETLLRRALEIKVARLGPDDVAVAHTLFSLGVCLRQADRPEEAGEVLRRALAIRETKIGPRSDEAERVRRQLEMCCAPPREAEFKE